MSKMLSVIYIKGKIDKKLALIYNNERVVRIFDIIL